MARIELPEERSSFQCEEYQQPQAEEQARLAAKAQYTKASKATRKKVQKVLSTEAARKVSELVVVAKNWVVLGYRGRTRNTTTGVVGAGAADHLARPLVVLEQSSTVAADDGGNQATQAPVCCCVWATKDLAKILDGCGGLFESSTDERNRTTHWLPHDGSGKLVGPEIEIGPSETFRAGDGQEVAWNPIQVVAAAGKSEKTAPQEKKNKIATLPAHNPPQPPTDEGKDE